MNAVRILHCADLHLDAPLIGLSEQLSDMRQEELRETFGRIVDMVKAEKVQVLLISGDLFDRETVKKTTVDHIINKLQTISNIPVLISAGNHDSLSKNYYYRKEIWPQNVHIFDSTMGKVDFPEYNLCVYGVSFNEAYQDKGLLKGFTAEDDSKINIMVIHGEILSPGSTGRYNPITLADIENSKLDYLALGHVHAFSGINKVGKSFWSYPGTPEGKGFDEKGQKGILIGEVSKNYCQMEFIPINKRAYMEYQVDISSACTYDEIAAKIRDVLDEDSQKNFYKIILTGEISEDFNINSEIIKNKLKDMVFNIKIINETSYSIDLSRQLSDDTLKNVFINKMCRIINESEEENMDLYKRALKIGINALNGERIDFDASV